MSGVGSNPVRLARFRLTGKQLLVPYHLAKIEGQFLIFVAVDSGRSDPGGINVGGDVLRRIPGKVVIKKFRLHAVPAHEIKFQVEIIVEPVRRH